MNPKLAPFINICLKEAWSETRSFFSAYCLRKRIKFTIYGKKFVVGTKESAGAKDPRILIFGPDNIAKEEGLELSTLRHLVKNYLGVPAAYVNDERLSKGDIGHGLATVCVAFTRQLSDQSCAWIKREVEEYGAGLIVLGGDNLRKSFAFPLTFNGYAKARGPVRIVREDSPLFAGYKENKMCLKFGDRDIARLNPTGGSVVAVYPDGNVFAWQGELGQGKVFYLNADLLGSFLAEVCRHNFAANSPSAICNFIHLFKTVYKVTAKQIREPDAGNDKAIVLFTVDTEAQGRYFDNSRARCTDCLGNDAASLDTTLSAALERMMERVRPDGIPLTFMLTTAELDDAENDLWGAPLAEKEKSLNTLARVRENGHDIGYHAYRHEDWLKKGYKFLLPMSPWEKLEYFRDSGLGWRTIYSYLKFIYKHSQRINKIFTFKGINAINRQPLEHREPEITADVAGWRESLSKVLDSAKVRMARYPGLARSPEVIAALDQAGFVLDSSDIYDLNDFLVPVPYRLLKVSGEMITETGIWEIPALFIDPYLRSSNSAYNRKFLEFVQQIIANKESHLVLFTHDKVIGAESAHLHVYMGNPFVSLGLPLREENLSGLLDIMRDKVKFTTGTAMAEAII